MRAHERRGITRGEVQRRLNERWQPDQIEEFVHLQWYARREREYMRRNRNRAMRTLIGPPEFNGPVYRPGHAFVGEIVNGRIVNGVTILHYWCIRGMSDEAFADNLACCRRAIDHMRRCAGPKFPDRRAKSAYEKLKGEVK